VFPEEEEPFWSLWWGARQEGGPPSCVVAHFFQTATSYVYAGPDCELAEVEPLLREELLPERLVGSLEQMGKWREASPGFFERASGCMDMDVMVYEGEGEAPPNFRAGTEKDLACLDAYGQLYAAETEDEFVRDFESLLEAGLVFVIEEEGLLLGYVRSNLSDGRYVHGGGLFVHPKHRGKGVGRALALGLGLRVRADSGATLILDVNCENEAAAWVYRAAGFRKKGAGLEVRFPDGAWKSSWA
jgi:ribosomal protein S18 acetylase RimI-like enzyme